MKEIKLGSSDKVIFVDDEDYDMLNKYHWCLTTKGYPQASICKNGRKTTIKLYQLLLKVPEGMEIDHKDRNPLNNSKKNLRICTDSQNRMNSTKIRGKTSSKYKGVKWKKSNEKWCANITINGKREYLGQYDIEEDAALAYDRRAKELFGEFANINNVIDDGRKLKGRKILPAGIWRDKNKWRVYIKMNGKDRYVGIYLTEQEAITSQQEALEKIRNKKEVM